MYRRNRTWRNLLVRFGSKPLILAIALVITISGTFGGSLAWLTATTQIITNVFTIGDIDLELDETETDPDDDDPNNNEYNMDEQIDKDPKVTVGAGSKKCWVYVKIETSANFDTYLEYNVDSAIWTPLGSEPGVYYRLVDEAAADQVFYILEGGDKDTVHVKPDVTQEQWDALDTDSFPFMKIKAFAVQWADREPVNNAVTAWAQIDAAQKNLINPTTYNAAASNVLAAPSASAPRNYAQRMEMQAEEGWIAFASPNGQ